jgi:hypothetical protein
MRIRILGMSSFEREGFDKQPWHARAGLKIWNEGALVVEANPGLWSGQRRGGDGGSGRKLHGRCWQMRCCQ